MCIHGGGKVLRISPQGKVVAHIALPNTRPTWWVAPTAWLWSLRALTPFTAARALPGPIYKSCLLRRQALGKTRKHQLAPRGMEVFSAFSCRLRALVQTNLYSYSRTMAVPVSFAKGRQNVVICRCRALGRCFCPHCPRPSAKLLTCPVASVHRVSTTSITDALRPAATPESLGYLFEPPTEALTVILDYRAKLRFMTWPRYAATR